MSSNPLYVTQPDLPPLDEFIPLLRQIWDSKVLTNGGPFHCQLEQALCAYLDVEHLALCSNGTIALIIALKALRITGEVITTPYSFVATAHALLWNNITPVFVDIDPRTLNLDPTKIEAAITPRTTAIMPVHCYGNPCDVDAIQTIADNYNLRVIYDAAHAFGVHCHCGSLLKHGDLSVLSFHATKVFNTLEGGAIVSPDAKTKQHIDHLKNFGFVNETTVVATGINGKMNEVQAALGLLQLQHVDTAMGRRARIAARYRDVIEGINGLEFVPVAPEGVSNFAYFPILVGDEYGLTRDQLYDKMKTHCVHTRRYFFPLLSNLPMYRGLASAGPDLLPVASDTSDRILCLPIYPAMSDSDQERVLELLAK